MSSHKNMTLNIEFPYLKKITYNITWGKRLLSHSYLKAATRILESATHERSRGGSDWRGGLTGVGSWQCRCWRSSAALLDVHFHVLASHLAAAATIGTRQREASALGVVGHQGLGHKLLTAVATCDKSLWTLVGSMLSSHSPCDLETTFIFAVHWLVTASTRVILSNQKLN